MTLDGIDEAVRSGARLEPVCQELTLSARTVQRWRKQGGGEDRRLGPKSDPPNKLSPAERQRVLEIANAPEHRDLSPRQIVPNLADQGVYVASESTFYRILNEEGQLRHRHKSRPASGRKPREHVATEPCQVWSWDITYLKNPVRGIFYYLYLFMDIWSRKIVGAQVYDLESSDLASELFESICDRLDVDPSRIVLHSDNGSPMKGSSLLTTLQSLGVVTSFSRPSVSDDNPYSEALFRTLKYRPEYPSGPFESLEDANAWASWFVDWYNTEHLHSAIRFVTPDDRHSGREAEVLRQRREVYEKARAQNPKRWSGSTRNWDVIEKVYLNPEKA